MRRPSNVVVACFVIAVAVTAAVFVWRSRVTRPGDGAQASELSVPAAGRRAVVRFLWRETSTARLANGEAAGLADALDGELELDADLVLSRETTTDGADAVRAEIREVRRSRVFVAGQEVPDARVTAQPVHLVLEGGRIAKVLVDRNAGSLAVQLVENVARQVLVPRPAGESGAFEREEETPAGILRVSYEPKGVAFTRTVTDAVAISGLPDRCDGPCAVRARSEGLVRFDEDGGTVLRVVDRREIRAGVPGAPAMFEATASFDATRVDEGASSTDTLDVAALAAKLPGEPFESEADRRAALTRSAEGASIDEVLTGIATVGTSGVSGLPRGWLVRSTALLELEPKLLGEVAIRFEDEGLGTDGRMAILDLLAATGGDHARATLLKVLDSPAAREDDARLAFVQRLMLVEEPNGDLARAVRDRLSQSRGAGDTEMAYAEAHVLGAIAGRLAARGAGGEARAATAALAGALDRAETPAARAAFVSALGNAGDAAEVPRIARHAADADPKVRRSVASALRKTHEPAARRTLLGLAKDADDDVQTAAVDALAHHPVGPDEQRELAQLVDGAQMGGAAEAQVVTLLLRQGHPTAEVRGSLEHVLGRTEDPRLAAQIRFALESAGY
jgi:hypothetical protein